MLTEGWDANTVTHILGVRAFGTQLLCEQVVGRGLRRMSYVRQTRMLPGDKRFKFERSQSNTPRSTACRSRSFPSAGAIGGPEARPDARRAFAPSRSDRLRDHLPARARLPLRIAGRAADSQVLGRLRMVLTTADMPTKVENAPIVGETVIHTLDELKNGAARR